MEEQKRLEEKRIIEILALFEQELDEKLQESKGEVERVKYYETFNISGIDFNNIFLTTEKDADGRTTYHIYCGDSSNEILTVDENGNIEVKNPELGKYLENININQLIEENEKDPQRLKGVSEKASSKEMKKALEGEENQEEKEEQEKASTEQIEADLQEQGQDLEISQYREITDAHISEKMPEVFKDGEENGIAFSNKLNRFVIISKVNGKYQLNENVEPARMTWKTIISIEPNGEKVERKVPYALMRLPNNPNKEIAVTEEEGDNFYKKVEIETVDVLPCQERIARQVREDGQGREEEESLELRREFETQGKEYKHDIAHQVQEIEQAQREGNGTVDYDITPDDYIPNTEMTWGELMENTGDSLPKLIERYNREMEGKTAEQSKEVVEEIEADYGNVSHEHKR